MTSTDLIRAFFLYVWPLLALACIRPMAREHGGSRLVWLLVTAFCTISAAAPWLLYLSAKH